MIEAFDVLNFSMFGVNVGAFSRFALILIMFGMGLNLLPNHFKYIFSNSKAFLAGLFGQIILLPLIALIVIGIFEPSPEISVGILIIACCPGAATSNFITYLARGELALSISITAASGLLTIFTLPVIINTALNFFEFADAAIRLPILKTIWNIASLTAAPVFVGIVVNIIRPDLAYRLQKLVSLLSFAALLAVMYSTGVEVKSEMSKMIDIAFLPVFIMNAVMVCIGLMLASVLRLQRKEIITLGVEVGFQNYILAIVIAIDLLGNYLMSIPAIIYLFCMYFSASFIVGGAIYSMPGDGSQEDYQPKSQ
mgnify:CR=1 FL=1